MAEATSSSRNKIYALGVVGFLAIISILYYLSAPVYLYIVAYTWFGFIYGALQQYGRFCFASAWRDLIMVRVPRMFVGIMMGLMTLSIISAALMIKYPSFYHPSPIGPHELVGGLIFGLGMVFAGGCATGSLYKSGEGNMISLTVLLTLSFTQAIFVAFPFFDEMMDGLHLTGPNSVGALTPDTWHWPQYLMANKIFNIPQGEHPTFIQNLIGNSLINTILIAMVLLVCVYLIYVRKNFLKRRVVSLTKSADGGEVKMGIGDDLAGFWSMISSSKRTTIAAVLLAVVAAIQVFTMSWMRDDYNFGDDLGGGNFGLVFAQNADGSRRVMFSEAENKTLTPAQKQEKIDSTLKKWPAADPAEATQIKYNGKLEALPGTGGNMFDPGYWYITTQEAMFAGWVIDKVIPESITGNLRAPHYNTDAMYPDNVREVLPPDQEVNGNRYFGGAGVGGGNALPKPWLSPALLLSIGLILGASFLSLWNKEFKWKFPTKELAVYAVGGGILMGIGSRIALGCNIGAFYTRASFGSWGGWLFFFGMGIGAFVSAKAVNYIANKKMAKQMEDMDFDIEL
ncbi:MAG: YeeE/YedE thiosulfate transporter family protein [Thermoleophilia bacterium]